MTRKDYELIARVLRFHRGTTCYGELDEPYINKRLFVKDLARELANENPRFDSGKFFEACDIEDNY